MRVGENSFKYGMTRDYVKSLEVVLANGEKINTKRLTKRELNKKKGETSFEAEIYRKVDGLITDNVELIKSTDLGLSKNSAGYELRGIKNKDGSFDLTPLFVGSQGTLGLITEITLRTEPYNPNTNLILAFFDDITKAGEAVGLIRDLKPLAIEMVDENLLNFVQKHNPRQLNELLEEPFPKLVLIVEFDNDKKQVRNNKSRKAKKILRDKAYEIIHTEDIYEQEVIWKIRHSAAAVAASDSVDGAKALPVIEDGIVPQEKFTEFLEAIYAIFKKYNLEVSVWGHAGDANLHTQPFLNLAKTADRQKMFKLMDEYYDLLIKMGGTTNGEHSDGRLRAPYLPLIFGEEMYDIYKKINEIFDPYNTLNPGVIIGTEKKDLPKMLRREFSMKHLADHLPRT
jgi:FAD/FMN-containing dehydrogenase